MVVIDAVIRLVPGVLGDEESNRQDSFSGDERLLEFAQYTRPREFRGLEVPEVLLSGDHEQIARWRERAKRSTNPTSSGPICGTRTDANSSTTQISETDGQHAARRGDHARRRQARAIHDNNEKGSIAMSQQILELVEKSSLKTEVPEFEIGDTVDVHTRILEGEKERIQIFNGVVIARSGSGTREMFVVRRIVQGEGVERKFPAALAQDRQDRSQALAASSAGPSCTSSAIASARPSA